MAQSYESFALPKRALQQCNVIIAVTKSVTPFSAAKLQLQMANSNLW